MRHRLHPALAVAVIGAVIAVTTASADPLLSGPPTANWFGIYACANPNIGNGQWQVTAGQPFAVRFGGWASGTPGLARSFIPKDTSTLTVERPLGATPKATPLQWQAPFVLTGASAGEWVVYRWSDVLTLGSGEQMKLTFTPAVGQPARDLVPPSSEWDPTSAGLPPYDGTGLKYDGGLLQPSTGSPVSCTITGI